ncbi:MAG: ABC transporter ATP-binding protein/permease [Burkholderiales bacterium]|nr:ABC transporter ATP-binding protein/permease [Burkholderiales bacterium]
MKPAPALAPTEPAAAGLHWRTTLRDAWRLARPFWVSGAERRAGALELAAVVALTLASVWLNVRFNAWNNGFYDALQHYDLKAFWHGIGVFCALAFAYIVAAVYRQYLQQRLQIRWRAEMTQRLAASWLEPGRALRLAQGGSGATSGTRGAFIDNPDQRIANDVDSFVGSTLSLSLGLLNAVVTLASFIGILWGLSGALEIPGSGGRTLLGYMVWVALGYSLAGSWLTQRIGRPLTGFNAWQQRTEADFRYALVQVRDHAEAISLARGEPRERLRLGDRFDAVRSNWMNLIRATKRLTWFNVGFGQLANLFPLLAAAPRYFSHAIQLGGLMQTAQAFGQVQGAMSWFVDAYFGLADWQATVLRLAGFEAALREPQGAGALPESRGALCAVDGLAVATPDGHALFEVEALRLEAGERLLVEGPSGSGKSSLLRQLAGLWPASRGRISMPEFGATVFVPQRPYLPAGSLAEALAYPHPTHDWSHDAMKRALRGAGLAELVPELERPERWGQRLSPGEQQRLQFARLLLQRPDWIFLDEATSALDDEAQKALYEGLFAALPGAAVLSVGHRTALRRMHERRAAVRAGRLVEDDIVARDLQHAATVISLR